MSHLPMRSYQRRVLADIRPGRSLLNLEYGSGKSWVAIVKAVEAWRAFGQLLAPILVFAPSRNLHSWAEEISLRAVLYPARPFVLIPHHRMRIELDEILDLIIRNAPAAVIMDESTAIANPNTKITEAALAISEACPPQTLRLCLTGNPMPENPKQLYTQVYFTNPSHCAFGDSYYRFLNRFFIRTDYDWVLDNAKAGAFKATVKASTIELTDEERNDHRDAVGVSYRNYVYEYYEESKEQRKLIDQLYSTWSLPSAVAEEPDTEFNYAMQLMQKAQQISSGFYYEGPEHQPTYLKGEPPKARALLSLITSLLSERECKIIIWYNYTAEMDMITEALHSFPVTCRRGPDAAILKMFHGDESPSVILMPTTVTKGFNDLVCADTAIWYSNAYSQEKRNQAEARIDRLGQKSKTLTFIDLVCPTQKDMEIVTALRAKRYTSGLGDQIALKVLNDRSQSSSKKTEMNIMSHTHTKTHATKITCTRRLTFCAGHRVMGHENKCAHMHGHNYVVHITAESTQPARSLDSIGRVIDFSVIKDKVGSWIESFWDHGFILCKDDQQASQAMADMGNIKNNEGQKIYTMPCNPTAENLAYYLLNDICPRLLIDTHCQVTKVVIEETENCSAEAHLDPHPDDQH